MKSFVLENGYFLLNDGSGRLVKGALRVEGNIITKIGKSIAKQKGEKRISLAGKLLIPGFVQTHTHLCQTLFRNLADDLELLDWLQKRIWPLEGAHNENSLYASARLGISELLAGGTTTILDMGTVRHTESIFEAAKEMGIRAFIGKCLMDRDSNPSYLKESIDEAMNENVHLLEKWNGKEEGRIRYAQAPRFLLSCTDSLMREVAAIATMSKTLIHTHSSENRSEIQEVKKIYGKENVEAFVELGVAGKNLILAHCIHLTENEKNLLSKHQIKVSHCPSSNLKLASGLCDVPNLKKRGITVSIGADGSPCNNNLNMFLEMRLASLLQKPNYGPRTMPAREVFEMATIEGAKALGIEKEIGSLEVGKKADFSLIENQSKEMNLEPSEKNPEEAYSALVYSASSQNVRETWVDGKSLYRKGSFTKANFSEIVKKAALERKKLLSRAANFL
jgi:5-methylthioadenosine/S-adenosylhomocysteine deaminase